MTIIRYSMEFTDYQEAEKILLTEGYLKEYDNLDGGVMIESAPDYMVVHLGKIPKYNPDSKVEPEYNDGHLVDLFIWNDVDLTKTQKKKLPLLNPQPNPLYRKLKLAGE
jgi:hypothetical protein